MRKITLCLMIIFALIIIPGAIFAQAVSTEEQFITAVKEGNAVEISKALDIKLEEDITITKTVTIGTWGSGKATVTIDLNGHTIKLNGSSAYLYVQNTGTLIIEDSVGTGLITNAGATSGNGNLIQVKGICQINGGTVENTLSSKNALYLQGETKVATGILNGGTIKNSYTGSGRAVSVGKGTFTMNGGKVVNKAAGSDGLVPAIQGGEITIIGGTIESAGTGIQSSNANVKITEGTIEAGWFGLHTSYATINPAEGKTVNISAGRAAVIAYDKLKTGEGNEIYGGNFDAPVLMESKYACYPTNVEVYGGIFTHDVSAELVAPGYVVNKVGDKYKVELNTPNILDDKLKAEDEVEIGVTPEVQKQLEEIFKKEIDENKDIQDALLAGKQVDIHIQMEKVETDEVKEELEAVKEAAKDKEIAKIYDITLVVKVDGTPIDTIPETSNKLKFKVLIPEDLIKENRTFFMYRYHDGEVKEITGEIDDENYFVFESDRFSTYVLAYEDKVVEPKPEEDNTGNEGIVTPPTGEGEAEVQPEDNKTENKEENKIENEVENKLTTDVPKTGDNVAIFAVLAVVAIAGIVLSIKMRKK